MKISYCVGVHNEASILIKNVKKIDRSLLRILGKGNYEILIIDNGSTDRTSSLLPTLKGKNVKSFCIKKKGFGAAFKVAVQNAKYEHVVFTAIDIPFGFTDLSEAIKIWKSSDLIFGSKSHSRSVVTRPLFRKISSFVYQILLSLIFNNEISDTQGSLFVKKSRIRRVLPYITADNAFFSTQLAIYGEKLKLKIKEVPVVLKKDSSKRKSRYKVLKDSRVMLLQVFCEALRYNGGKSTFIKYSLFFFLIFLLSFLSFDGYKGMHLYFWRDDWTAFWFLKNDLKFFFFRWILPSRHPGEFLSTFPWFYLFGTNLFLWQISGVFLKTLASFSVGVLSYVLFKNKKIAIFSIILFASYFGGLEGFTWVGARLSGILIVLYGFAIYLFGKINSDRRIFVLLIPMLLVLMFMEPGRSIFFIGLLVFLTIFNKKSKKFNIGLLIATVPVGLVSTSYGRTMLGFKSAELVSPYESDILQKAFSLSSIKQYFSSLATVFVGQSFADSHPNSIFKVAIVIVVGALGLSFLLFIIKSKVWKNILFLLIWIIVFYSASWISDPGSYIGAGNRYFTLSGVGVVVLISFFIAQLKFKVEYFLLFLFLIFNLFEAKLVINSEYMKRGDALVVPLLNRQANDVRDNFNGGVFIVTGWHTLKGYVFDWSYGGGLPYALFNNISDPLKVPVMASLEDTQKVICGHIPQHYYLDNYVNLTPNKLTPDHVYSWNLNSDGVLEETTLVTRKTLSGCLSGDRKL